MHRSGNQSTRWIALAILLVAAVTLSGCAALRAYRNGERAAASGDWDTAVVYYRRALQEAPGKPEYKIALERAMLQASLIHLSQARVYEEKDELSAAVIEYRKAAELDTTNQQASENAARLEATLRDRMEASRPKPPVEAMREEARRQGAPPLLNPASREPLELRFTNASTQDILNFIGANAGINVLYERDFRPQPFTINLVGVTLEEALNYLMTTNQLWYKVLNQNTIMIIPDTPQKRLQHEEQVVRTFYLSNSDPQELSQMLTQVLRVQGAAQPSVLPNKTANTITVRGTAGVVNIMERIIQANDRPRAEIVVDIEILEVNRTRAKTYGLNLSQYSIGTIFSPETRPSDDSNPLFNLNTISQGISTADFYLSVPQAVVNFLESDDQTKLIAKPQLRGAEGQKLTLNLGDEIPVPSTVFTPLAAGGATANPLTSFQYRPIGVNVEMTPRVTYENEIILELTLETSTLGGNIDIAGQALPTFGSRKVVTKLRLREGESNLLAGLLREDDRKTLRGFPGIMRLPVFRQLLSDNDTSVEQTDIVMLLTPRIVRTHNLTQENFSPVYIGTSQNLGLGGPAPLIAAPPEQPPPAEPGAVAPGAPRLPEGTSPIPGFTTEPPRQPPQVAPAPPTTPTEPPQPPPPTAAAQVLVTPPGPELRMGGGPYTVPISIAGASRLSTVSLTVTYNPAVLRVETVQEGSFMRQGGLSVTFTQQVDAGSGRVDMTITRGGDATGASGTGLLAAVLFAPVAPGSATLAVSGVATSPEGSAVDVAFVPAAVTVR